MKPFYLVLFTLFVLSPFLGMSQTDDLKIRSFKEVDSLMANEPKNVVVFFHTDWCKYCEQMKQTTLKNVDIISLLNQYFYFISFDAESKADVTFAGQTFKYVPSGKNSGVHEIAQALATIDGKLNYPSLSILSPSFEITFQYGALLGWQELKTVLNATLSSTK